MRRWLPPLHPTEDLLIVENDRFLHRDGDEDRDGRPVAIVRVARVRAFTPADIEAACAGTFEDGWWAWELVDVRPLSLRSTVRAARGIYAVLLPEG